MAPVRLGSFACGALLLIGCAPLGSGGTQGNNSSDLSHVPTTVIVNGQSYDVESEYLPRVVECENGDAPTESLKAQAIASRTYLTYRTLGQSTPTIQDGQSDQVFTCSSNQNGSYVSSAVQAAVAATAGQVVTHADSVVAGFFVSGANRDSDCEQTSDPTNTERFVTINVDKVGSEVQPSSIGSASDHANRGAMGQDLANCLATRSGYDASQLMAYFYGADIVIVGDSQSIAIPATTSTTPAVAPAPTAPATTTTTANPACVDPTTVTSYTPCFSYTLQCWVTLGSCVQSVADSEWYQCGPDGGFTSPVDTDAGTGPVGACTSVTSLP